MTKRLKSRSAYDSDGRALPPGGDISGDPAAWLLLSWSRHTYDGTRPASSLYSDGTFESNVWDCCRLTSATARDVAVTEHDAFPADGLAFSREVSLAALPGAVGRYPAAETFSDGLGRVTNSLRAVWFNGARDAAYTPLETRTEYPYGTDDCSLTAAPPGVQTLARRYYGDGCETEETVTPGVTNRVTRYSGGATVEEKYWDGKWTRETRSDTYNQDGCRVETVVTESSDYLVVTNSVTAYDFLGRAASIATPLGVTSNFYDGASSRILRVSRTGEPDTLYEYEAGSAGVPARTALDVDANGVIDLAGTDRINSTVTRYEEDASNVWWRVTSSASSVGGVTNALTITREQLTGLSPALLARTVTTDANAFTTTVTRAFEPGTDVIVETSQTGAAAPVLRRMRYGHALEDAGADLATLSTYDGFGRVASQTVTNGTGTLSTSAIVYDNLGNAMTNATAYGDLTAVTAAGYDGQGRAASRTDALGNTVFTQYDSLGQALSLSGATYPVQYAYDSDSRQTELNTTRDGLTWDKTRFLFDGATGLLTNKVYADNSRVSYSYTQSGRPLRTEWAHGVWKEDGYDTIGQLTGTAYSDGTPTASYAYTAVGFLAASSNAMARYQYQNADSGVATNTAVLIGTNAFTVSKTLDPFTRLAVLDTDSAQSPVIYGYNAENALASVSNQTFEVAYRFDGARDMGYAITLTNGLTVTRALTRDPHRRHLVTAVSNAVGASAHSLIEYSHNILGNVTNRNGDAFSYNPRSEVSGAVTGTNVFDYAYDGIGNNTVVTVNAAAAVYTANALNQYTAISLPALNPQYDADGNLTAYGDLTLTWDAENRNTAVLSNDVLIVASGYDPQHRRVIKTTSAATRTFLYDGWLPVLEKIILSNGTAEVREHVWGKDLSGTREGAGGVGGLLATRIGDAWYFPLYDANGNITDYVNKSGAVVAHREYGPFGETLAATGPMADDFNFWFSTKYLDHETGLYYYGHRFYSPEFMRWLNRDPIWERDGANVYVFVKNEPVAHTDALGLMGNAPPDSVTKGCCAGKIYNLGTECCCRDKVYSKAAKPSGIRRCCRYNWTGVIPQHCWIEWPGGSAGLYPDANAPLVGLWGSPGIVAVPEPDTSNKQCTQIHLSDCDCNIDAVKACIADVASKHANGSWLSPTYNFGIFDCRHYPGYLVSGCCSAVGCGGSWPSLSTISPW